MRLTTNEKTAIVDCLRMFDPKCQIFLYGSRTHPKLAGGDIDLFVISESIGFSEKISGLVEIKKRIGEQKIDITVKTLNEAATDPFFQSIKNSCIELE